MNRFLLFSALFIVLSSCQKEINIQLDPSGSGAGNGNGSGTGMNYQPTTKGSYWTYKSTGARTYESTSTSTGVKKAVNNINYTIITTLNAGSPASESMYGMKGRDYYMSAAGVSPNSGATFDITFRYLNDTAAVGYKWDHIAGQGNGFLAQTRGEIIARNLTMTVAGKSYKEVIHTKVELDYEIPGFGLLPAAVYDYYVANNIGLIKVVTATTVIMGGEVIESELTAYSIK
jgi:hypothetical protein